MYETRNEHLLPVRKFLARFVKNLLFGLFAICVSLGVGMAGYHYFEGMPWIDAYVNAAMILSGMGPVSTLQTDAGKAFAGSYALFSGIVFLLVMVIVLAPIVHRFFHKFHFQEK